MGATLLGGLIDANATLVGIVILIVTLAAVTYVVNRLLPRRRGGG